LQQEPDKGAMQFAYLPSAAYALSLSLPLSQGTQPFAIAPSTAFFGGLLPEGDEVRKAIAKRYEANPRNEFSLLRAIGYDCAGAVSLHGLDEPIIDGKTLPFKAQPISSQALAQHIRDLPKKPLFMDAEGLRLSLAGVQDKASVCLVQGQVALPSDGTLTTHIIKPAIATVAHSVLNEHFCMSLAKAVGLNVANVELREVEDLPFLLIERYDRVVHNEQTIQRIHQEDVCQALAIPAAFKYQNEGGPSLADCFELMNRLTVPAMARLQLLDLVLFNLLIGNGDAHGKNYSLLHHPTGQSELAPAYDLLCTLIYPDMKSTMAMRFGNAKTFQRLNNTSLKQFTTEAGLGYPLVKKRLVALTSAIATHCTQAQANATHPFTQELAGFITQHSIQV
jgi:serine/threonine-protein kinase HipA